MEIELAVTCQNFTSVDVLLWLHCKDLLPNINLMTSNEFKNTKVPNIILSVHVTYETFVILMWKKYLIAKSPTTSVLLSRPIM